MGHTGEITDTQVTLGEKGPAALNVLRYVALFALVAGFGLGLVQNDGLARFLHSYLVSFCFILSISLGALFFVMVHHACRAGWGVALRRIAELLAANLGLVAALFLPILIPVLVGHHGLYEWINPELVRQGSEHFDPLALHKRPYLNSAFFSVRAILYLAMWWLAADFYLRRSVKQDASGDPALTRSMERWSGPALILFGITVTFAAFDWLMSLDYDWFSTIFGVYFFAGSVVASVSSMILVLVALQASGRITSSVTAEHYHDLGKLLLAFVVFWGYMAFSQYMLIWYSNIPEETRWYLTRQTGGWIYLSLALLFGHLLIPFFGLLPRGVKRRPRLLAAWAAWMLVFHWLDLYWLVMPSLEHASSWSGLAGILVSIGMDASIVVGMTAAYLSSLISLAGDKALIPLRDPRLAESLAFENF